MSASLSWVGTTDRRRRAGKPSRRHRAARHGICRLSARVDRRAPLLLPGNNVSEGVLRLPADPRLLSSPGNKRRLSILHAGDRVCLQAGRSCGTRPAPPAMILLAGRHRFLAPVVHAVACTAPSGWRRCLRCNPSTPRAMTGPHLPFATCTGMTRCRAWPSSLPTLAWPAVVVPCPRHRRGGRAWADGVGDQDEPG